MFIFNNDLKKTPHITLLEEDITLHYEYTGRKSLVNMEY